MTSRRSINRFLLFLCPLLVHCSTCNDRIRLNRQQHSPSIYCSSCAKYIDEQILAPIIEFELPSLTQLTGIFIQESNPDQQRKKIDSYFIEYRRTQDGPWQVYGKRQQQKLFIERRRLFSNDNDNSNETRTFLSSFTAHQIRIIFITSSISICTVIQVYGCQSQNGLISTRFPQRSIINIDLKYDGLITNVTARGGLGTLTDGDIYQFIHWSPLAQPILLLFAFDSIKEFQSISIDLKCSSLLSSNCVLKINVGILEIAASNNLWTNRFHSISINSHQYRDNLTLTHLILSVPKMKGQFVIIQINTKESLAISEVTFKNRNEYDDFDIVPSSIYIEANLRRLELLAMTSISNEIMLHYRLSYLLMFTLIVCALLSMFLLISRMFREKKIHIAELTIEENERSSTMSVTHTTNDGTTQNHSQLDLYSNLENNGDELISDHLQLINSQSIINESSKATIRTLTSHRQSRVKRCSSFNRHSIYDHLSELDPNEIVIMENLGARNNHQCFYSEYGQNKLSVLLYEHENNEFFNLSRLVNHQNIVSCLGYVNLSPERCFLVSEYSRINLLEYSQTIVTQNEHTLMILMGFLNEIVAALIHLESLNIMMRDLTLPNCLLFNDNRIKLSDYAKYDDRYTSRYVEQKPIRWLPGDIVTKDESWSIRTNTFMFGSLVFELFHLGTCVPYNDLTDDEVVEFFRDLWPNSKQNSIEPSVLCFSTHFPRPILCNDRIYALIERCLSWSSLDRPSFREISLCVDETTTVLSQ